MPLATPSEWSHHETWDQERKYYSHQYEGGADTLRLERDEKVKRRMVVGGNKLEMDVRASKLGGLLVASW